MLWQYHWFLSTRRRYWVDFTRVGHAWVQSTPSCLVISRHQNWLKRARWPIGCVNYMPLTTFPARLSHLVHDGVAFNFELVELELWYLRLDLSLEFHIFLHSFHGTFVLVDDVHRSLHPARVTGFIVQSLGLMGHFPRENARAEAEWLLRFHLSLEVAERALIVILNDDISSALERALAIGLFSVWTWFLTFYNPRCFQRLLFQLLKPVEFLACRFRG